MYFHRYDGFIGLSLYLLKLRANRALIAGDCEKKITFASGYFKTVNDFGEFNCYTLRIVYVQFNMRPSCGNKEYTALDGFRWIDLWVVLYVPLYMVPSRKIVGITIPLIYCPMYSSSFIVEQFFFIQ